MEEKKKKHLFKEQIGNVEVVIWPNESKFGKKYLAIRFSRSYRDKDGQYCNARAFFPNDLPCFQEALLRTMNWFRSQAEAQAQEPMPMHAMDEKAPESTGQKKRRSK